MPKPLRIVDPADPGRSDLIQIDGAEEFVRLSQRGGRGQPLTDKGIFGNIEAVPLRARAQALDAPGVSRDLHPANVLPASGATVDGRTDARVALQVLDVPRLGI